eukprot:6998100-Heterocapsa_arctica.AAC.1
MLARFMVQRPGVPASMASFPCSRHHRSFNLAELADRRWSYLDCPLRYFLALSKVEPRVSTILLRTSA